MTTGTDEAETAEVAGEADKVVWWLESDRLRLRIKDVH
jgi:hypothetical protein